MSESDTKLRAAREHSFNSSANRLEKRLQHLQAASIRISNLRLAIVVVGLIGSVALAIWVNPNAAWRLALLITILFIVVVIIHRVLERWIQMLAIWRALKFDQLARMQLDWEKLPFLRPIELHNSGLARDLDIVGYRSLYQLLDTAISRHGRQRLADWLMEARPDAIAIRVRQDIVRELIPRVRFRDRFRVGFLNGMRRELEGDNLLQWLKIEFPSRRIAWTLPIALVFTTLNLILFALNWFGQLPPYWVVTLTLYIAFYFWNHDTLEGVLGAIVRLHAEIYRFSGLLRYLEHASYANAPHLAALCAPLRDKEHPPSQRLFNLQLITIAVGLRSNPWLALILNFILPWDFVCALLADRQRASMAPLLPPWIEVVHELDALCALANFAYLNPETRFPKIRTDAAPVLQTRGMGHPLLPASNRVCNDFTIKSLGEVDILTGSNMAGKSTFLKTVGINLCLAYAGAPVPANEFSALPFRLHTCIRITDSIVDGFSYFYAEVKCLKALLNELEAKDDLPLLYLLDEIFRGTNNRERLIGSRAYLHSVLGAHGVGLIATHDLELAQLANENANAHNYHFRDDVSEGKLVFDYHLCEGPCPTTNALKIMELEGLPIGIGD